MKSLIFSFILLMSSAAMGNAFLDILDGKKPLCSSPLVRLSPNPIPCLIDELADENFDLPSLGLDLEDLEDIFNGAESSGGHVVGPMNAPQRKHAPSLPFPLSLSCRAKLLSDGGKRVSFLSKQAFELNDKQTFAHLFIDRWEHGIIEGKNLNSDNWVKVPVAPKVDFKNYAITLGYNKELDKLHLTACEANLKTSAGEIASACSETEFSQASHEVKTRLKTLVIKGSHRIQKVLDISCSL